MKRSSSLARPALQCCPLEDILEKFIHLVSEPLKTTQKELDQDSIMVHHSKTINYSSYHVPASL